MTTRTKTMICICSTSWITLSDVISSFPETPELKLNADTVLDHLTRISATLTTKPA